MTCLCCGAGAEVGVLCRGCAQQVAPCEGLIPDHVRSTALADEAEAWVVDGFGQAHALATRTAIGRHHEGQLVILAASVSREHARLEESDGVWTLRDLGSRNGTFVERERVAGRAALAGRTRVKIGDVALWFLSEVAHEPMGAPSMQTGSIAGGMVRFSAHYGGVELCVLGSSDATTGGSLLTRAAGTEAWAERSLAPLEFQLLRALCARAIEEAEAPGTVKGCVATRQLARDLPFQSKYANEENVRQVVRRLRTELRAVGVDAVIAVAPGRGYYLTTGVTAGGVDRAR